MSLSISALGGYDTFYPIYSAAPVNRVDAADRVDRDSRNTKTEPNDKAALMYPVETPILSFVQQAILPTLMQNCSSV